MPSAAQRFVRLADDANRSVTDANEVPRGTLRVTADPVFGEAFLRDLVVDYAKTWPEVRVDVLLTRRRVNLLEEGFDVAFRIGHVDDAGLSGWNLGPARVRYCASPKYVARRGAPARPEDLAKHECVVVAESGAQARWPFKADKGLRLLPVSGRLVLSSLALARAATLAGLGIALFPEFACAEDIRRHRLVPVLDGAAVEVGAVWLVHASRRFLPARVRAFVDLARERFGPDPPWLKGAEKPKTRG